MSDPRERFEDLVVEAMDGLPAWVHERLENVDVLIEEEPPPGQPNLLDFVQRTALNTYASSQRLQEIGKDDVLDELGRIVSGFVCARFIVSFVVGVIATAGLRLIGMPSWLLLGILVGIANLIPTVGSFVGAVPVVLVAILTKPPAFLLAAVAVMLLAHAVDGYILSPIVLKETTDLHPVVVLLAVVAGAEVMGLWGVFAAIPIAGIAQYGLKRWVAPRIFGTGDQELPVPVSAEDLPREPAP